MSEVNPEFIEKYQNIYEQDPNSKIFAPLAEAYRRMGLKAQALRVAERGVRVHPHFPSGRVALAKILIDTRKLKDAAEHLKIATELSPENLMAHRLLADCFLRLRDAKQALNAYKMVLYLNPRDSKAQKVVNKLESLSADDFDDEIFQIDELPKPPQQIDPTAVPKEDKSLRGLERYVSLIDAFIARNDLQRAESTMEKAEQDFPEHPEIQRRRQMLRERAEDFVDGDAEEIEPLPSRDELIRQRKLGLLKLMLHRIGP